MKKYFILTLFLSATLIAPAQWVTIPDENFANKLNELYPECMDGNLMNTECPDVVNATFLLSTNDNISDFTGIHHFTNLEYFDCRFNNLTSLPQLPPALENLICQFNNINVWPELPSSLKELRCQSNNLTALPELPPYLTELFCSSNNLTTLPELPPMLTTLKCWNNNLTTLPELPETLTKLACGINNLTSLPDLPPTLHELTCNDNQLTCLPALPMTLIYQGTYYFNLSNNPFTCVPNYVPAMSGPTNSQWLSYPICYVDDTENNPFGCSGLNGVVGTVYDDGNSNCEKDDTESGIVNATLKLLDESDELLATTTTFGNTLYNFVVDSGSYTVQLVTENMPFQPSCDVPGDSQEVELSTDEPTALNVDFGIDCLPGIDIGVQSVVTTGWVFPGQIHTLKIAAGDMTNWYGLQCAQDVSGTVTVDVDGPVSYVGPADDALTPAVTGELQLTYDIADFSAVNFQQDFALLLETDTTAQAEDRICVLVTVAPLSGDLNPENNSLHHCYDIVNSYDPNIKQVWPQNVEPGYDGYFNYTIYFQNTGSAPAFNIRVADTLDTNLDHSTFEVTAYSHECLTYVEGNVATFRFNDIMLPDSTSDFDGSIGYVQYRIKPIADLPVGTVIENTAHIFFDFNDAIVTNTTQNEYVIDTSTDHPQQQMSTVFPNPGTGQFNVLFSGVETGITTHLEVYNLNGQRVLQQQVNENRVVLNLTDYPSGMYLLHVRNENGSEAVKLMKQ